MPALSKTLAQPRSGRAARTWGFYTKMKMLSRRAYGFRNFENYRLQVLAEMEGFEPSMRFKPHAPLAGEYLQPLGHISSQGVILA